ncbi:FUSC family protein [Bosea sp. SSUT16]|uniref:FUSC family protein n=1 Tax=Bosea spartocytisi TaxID=2773451 RepID=A0A927HXY7_9HYPH|nr:MULTISPECIES: FUSC family protein [Bosea]MBD3844679.1 FUSC family protein [Bosea spartocytisi]MCT4470880.1 FUSC family protein [Bosea spartocytisi]
MEPAPADKGAGRESRRIRRLRGYLAELRKRLPVRRRLADGLEHALMSTVAALAAYLPTQALGLREGFWAAITAMAVVQTEFGATRTTARDQFVGAAIGGVIGVAVVLTTGQHIVSYAIAAGLSVLAAWLLNVATAARLAGITATIILLVPHPGTTAQVMMLSRVFEVGWGVSVAIVIVWLAERLDPRRPD